MRPVGGDGIAARRKYSSSSFGLEIGNLHPSQSVGFGFLLPSVLAALEATAKAAAALSTAACFLTAAKAAAAKAAAVLSSALSTAACFLAAA